jgi:hypothetical protein
MRVANICEYSFISQELYGCSFTTVDEAISQFESSTVTDQEKLSSAKQRVADAKKRADEVSKQFNNVQEQITRTLEVKWVLTGRGVRKVTQQRGRRGYQVGGRGAQDDNGNPPSLLILAADNWGEG